MKKQFGQEHRECDRAEIWAPRNKAFQVLTPSPDCVSDRKKKNMDFGF